MSPAWVSNTFFASGEDLSLFFAGLLRNGTLKNGTSFLSASSVNHIFTQHTVPKRPNGSCVGTQAFGMGVGYCEGREIRSPYPYKYVSKTSRLHPSGVGASMCTSERSWTWGSSHGSRFSLLRDKGIACVTIQNTPNVGVYPTRAHFIGHNMSSILRDVF